MVLDKVIYKILITILPTVLNNVTPLIKENLKNAIKELEEKARKTPNPVDDIFIDFLKALLDIE